jgi:4-hydroxybenzoate polyprenyltransferase
MDTFLQKVAPLLRLTRVSTAFAAVANLWFVVLWTRGVEAERANAAARASTAPIVRGEWPIVPLIGATLAGVGLFAFATALNDTLDRRRDRALHPERPIPSGAVAVETAALLVALTLLCAFLGSVLLGNAAVLLCLITAGGVLLFHTAAKYVPAVGLVLLGLIYGAHMLVGNGALLFVWPVWLQMSHALLVGAMTHRLAGRRPRLTPLAVTAAALGWVFWSGVLFGVAWMRLGGLWPGFVPIWAPIVPAALVLVFAAFVRVKLSRVRSRGLAAEKVQRYGSLWMPLYAIAWCLPMWNADGASMQAATIALTALAVLGLLGMTLLRELYSLAEHPVGFRR